MEAGRKQACRQTPYFDNHLSGSQPLPGKQELSPSFPLGGINLFMRGRPMKQTPPTGPHLLKSQHFPTPLRWGPSLQHMSLWGTDYTQAIALAPYNAG